MPYIHKTPTWLKKLYPSLTWDYKDRPGNNIYLTFDDGPIPEITEFVLDTLQLFDSTATFFCVGENIHKHPKVAEAILEEGHTIGNHTYNHIKGWGTPNQHYVDNISKCQSAINAIGESGKLFRPPYGRIGPNQIRQIRDTYEIVMWDVLTGDYNASLSSQEILRSIIKATRPGSIVLFHDSVKAYPRMKEVLPAYMSYFLAQGYSFERL